MQQWQWNPQQLPFSLLWILAYDMSLLQSVYTLSQVMRLRLGRRVWPRHGIMVFVLLLHANIKRCLYVLLLLGCMA
jgi:hypothetical protein